MKKDFYIAIDPAQPGTDITIVKNRNGYFEVNPHGSLKRLWGNKAKVLDLVLTGKWFDQIKAGQKTTEFRKKTAYWERRLKGVKKRDFIVFRRGYTNTTLTAAIVKITPYGFSALPREVADFMTGIEWGDLFYAIEFKLIERGTHGKQRL